MRLPRTLLFVVSPIVIVGAVGIRWAVRRRRRAPGPDVAAPPQGISDVDPEPLMGVVETIDPDGVVLAHHTVVDQRERLPRPGENLP
jgi:hypothetical protein